MNCISSARGNPAVRCSFGGLGTDNSPDMQRDLQFIAHLDIFGMSGIVLREANRVGSAFLSYVGEN